MIEVGHLVEQEASGNSWLLTKAAVLDFSAQHRNAREILPYFGDGLDRLIKLMAEHHIEPLLEKRLKSEAPSVNVIYRYEDLTRVFRLRHDPTRFDDPEFEAFWAKVRSTCIGLPPYLQLPSRLPVSGQTVSNGKRTYSFGVTYDPVDRTLVLDGRRQVSETMRLVLSIADELRSLTTLETALSVMTI
ncbi:hypothetical protein [Rhizobium leguminosarum]|uniref:hypothetical protein n=1 Tax=Rhizobium leguminosarum TaxID=384 RepID=UPI000417DF54|nr:hypothetical protein [Rhizobium leguminosarum]